MKVATYIAAFLREKNIRHVFGYQGSAIAKIIDEIAATGQIAYMQNFHEQASAFCADAYARVTDSVGVALATSGPGATNLITGIANAQLDSIPVLFITGQDHTANVTIENGARQNGFQDLDIVSIVKPITKHAVMVTDEKQIRYELEKSYWLARNGRPGAVLVDIPMDVQFREVTPGELVGFVPDTEDVEPVDFAEIVRRIRSAKRPIILAGGGIRLARATAELCSLTTLTNIPVVSTLNGLDAFEGGYGFAGIYGNTFANLAIQNADLLLSLGARFGQHHVGKSPSNYTRASIIHIDIDKKELRRIFSEELAIRADLKSFLHDLISELCGVQLPNYGCWHEKIKSWRDKYHAHSYRGSALDPVKVVSAMTSLLAPNAIITADVGQNQLWVAQGIIKKAGLRLLNSCGHGAMGYSLPAALAAKIAFPERQVIAFTGDGGLQMNLQEFMLMHLRQIGAKCVVFRNNALGLIRELQDRHYEGRLRGNGPTEFDCVDLERLAYAYRVGYRRVGLLDEISGLQSIFLDNKPYIIEVPVAFDTGLLNRFEVTEVFERERIYD